MNKTKKIDTMNYFWSFKLNVDNGNIIIDAILPIENNGTVIELIPVYECHYDDLSKCNEELLPKVGERTIHAQKRITSYIQNHPYCRGRNINFELRENLVLLGRYVNKRLYNANCFISFKLSVHNRYSVANKYIIIEAILPVERDGKIIEVIPLYEFHFDDSSDGEQELYPKVGEHFYDAKKRIESYIKNHQYWSIDRIIRIEIKENLRGLENYVNSLVHSSIIDTTI